jgi:hypothetical protein
MRPFADNLHYRLATPADIPHLGPLIETSIRGLQENDYSPFQIDQAIVTRPQPPPACRYRRRCDSNRQ